jgi:methionyl-tRNA synthetase
MMHRFSAGTIQPPAEPDPKDRELAAHLEGCFDGVTAAMERHALSEALERIWDSVRRTNQYIEENAPWTLNKQGKTARVHTVMAHLASAMQYLSVLLFPFIPQSAQRIREQLGVEPVPAALARHFTLRAAGEKVREGAVLFPRIETREKKAN